MRIPWISLLACTTSFAVLGAAVFVASRANGPGNTGAPELSAPAETAPAEGNAARVQPADITLWIAAMSAENKVTGLREPLVEEVAEGRQWKLSYPGVKLNGEEPLTIHVAYHPGVTVMIGQIATLPPDTPAPLLRALLQQNFDLYQSKIALSQQGELVVAYEVPNRLLDEEEFVSDIHDIARVVQVLTPQVTQYLGQAAARPQQPTAALE